MRLILWGAALAGCLFVAIANPAANDLSGTVRDVCGVVLPGTSVSAANETGTVTRATEGNGHYLLNGLAAGQWAITFELLGFQTLKQSILLPENGDDVQLNVRLLPDLLMKQELSMSHDKSNVRYRRYAVQGVVRTPSGEPVSTATVDLRDVGHKKGTRIEPCTTDDLGRYALTGWSPIDTKWQLVIQADGFRSYTNPVFRLVPDEPLAIDAVLEKRKP
jgi:hypothetical protein